MTLTPEQFMTYAEPDEDEVAFWKDHETAVAALAVPVTAAVLSPSPGDRVLISMADSLRVLAKSFGAIDHLVNEAADLRREVAEAHEAAIWNSEQKDRLQALVDQVLEVVKPSTSKLANAVRSTISAHYLDRGPEQAVLLNAKPVVDVVEEPVAEPAPVSLPEPADWTVAEWRAYARSLGHDGPEIDKANKSQIRTLLEQPHPGEGTNA